VKGLSRRDFLKLCAGSAAAVSLSEMLLPHLLEAAPASGNPPVLWLQGASCTGCSISLLNSEQPAIAKILTEVISLKYHPNVSGATGDLALKVIEDTEAAGGYFLVIEGAVPTKDNGIYCTIGERDGKPIPFMDWVKELGSKANAVLAVGTCAAFGGIPAATYDGNPTTHGGPTGCMGVLDFFKQQGIKTPVINIPGCPPHPDWMVGSLAHVLLYKKLPPMDKYNRPTMFFGNILHDNCQRRQYFDNSKFAKVFSEPYCLLELGCKGPFAACDSYKRQWNGESSCILVNGPCYACTDMNFPDGSSPIYQRYPDVKLPNIDASADAVGVTLGAAVVVGMAAHLVGNAVNGRLSGKEE
jgi:hydrogenase small subunit